MAFEDPTIHRVENITAEAITRSNIAAVELTFRQSIPTYDGPGRIENSELVVFFTKQAMARRFAAGVMAANLDQAAPAGRMATALIALGWTFDNEAQCWMREPRPDDRPGGDNPVTAPTADAAIKMEFL